MLQPHLANEDLTMWSRWFETYHMDCWSIVPGVKQDSGSCTENKFFVFEDWNVPEFVVLLLLWIQFHFARLGYWFINKSQSTCYNYNTSHCWKCSSPAKRFKELMHNWAHNKQTSTGPHGNKTQTKRAPLCKVLRYHYVGQYKYTTGAKTKQKSISKIHDVETRHFWRHNETSRTNYCPGKCHNSRTQTMIKVSD